MSCSLFAASTDTTRRLRAVVLLLAVLATARAGDAATYTWSGGGTGTWSTDATNWTAASGTPWDGTSGPANVAVFATAGDAAALPGSVYASQILFSSPTVITDAGSITLTTGSLVVSSTSAATSVAAMFTGTAPLIKAGAGTLALSAANSFTGPTAIAGGVLQLTGGANRLPTTGTLSFTGSNTVFDVTNTSQTLSAMTFVQPTSGTAAMTISGVGGSVTVSGTANFEVGPLNCTTAGIANSLSMTNLSAFTYTNPAGTFRVGLKASSTNSQTAGTSSIVLAQSNAITATTIGIADVQANTNGGRAQLLLGQSNAFNVTTIAQGSNRSDSRIAFQAGLTNPSLVIRGTGGTGPMGTWTVGQVAQTTSGSQNFVATVDLSAGTIDAAVTTLTIGQANCVSTNRSGVQRSSFTMGSGTLAAGTIMVGRMLGGAGSNGIAGTFGAYGTLAIRNPAAVVSATNVYVAENTFSGTIAAGVTATVSGTINLSAGMLQARTLSRGTQTGVAGVTVSPTFLWTGGTIGNLAGSGLTVSALPLTLSSGTGTFLADAGQTITVNDTAPISGGGTLVKAGAGSLVLQGVNTYTGPTAVSTGTLALGPAGSIGSSGRITVDAGATLDASAVAGGLVLQGTQVLAGAGSIAGGLTVGGSTAVIPPAGVGPLSVTGGLTLAADGSYAWQMLDATGTAGTGWGLISTDAVSFSGLSSSSPFRVNLWSQSAVGTNGDAQNFDPAVAASWRILTSASTISGFDPANFALTTSAAGVSTGFTNPVLGGTFSLALSGDALGIDLKYTPYVPYTWYGNGATAGGSGTWSSAGVTWNDGSSLVAWNPVMGALFGTSGGTVTVSGPQSVGYGMSFTAEGYRLTGDALTFTGDQAANTVTVTGTSTATIETAVTATGGMVKSGVGRLVLAGDTAAAGGVSLQLGTLAVGAGGTAGTLAGDVATSAGTTLVFDRSDDSTYAGAVSGAGGLRKAGAGTLTLTGSSSYSGGTVLTGGTVALGSADALGSSGTIAMTGGAIQYSAANTADYSARLSTGSGQAFVIDTNGQTVSFTTGLAGAGNPLTKLGDGTLSLSGSGSFTGGTRIVAGTLELATVGALAGSTLDMNAADAGTLALSLSGSTYALGGLRGSRNIDVGSNVLAAGANGESTTYDGAISGAGGFSKTGTGTMLLTATQAYLGTTGVNGGTLRVTASNQLASTGTLSLGGSDAIFDIGSTTQTLATMTTGNGGAFTNMAVTGSGGSLVLTGPGNVEVGPGGTTAAGQRAVVSLAGISTFSSTVPDGTFRVGLKGSNAQSGAPGVSSLTLATTNTIVSGTLGIGDIGGNNDGGGAQLLLGQTNDVRTGYVSMSASRADSLLQFAPGTASPTLVLRGTDGSGPAGTWLVGSVGQFSAASKTSFTSTVDLSGGTTDAAVGWLVIGQANCSSTARGGNMRSIFTMGAGTLATGSITVGRMLGGSATTGVSGVFGGYGTLAIANPAAVVTATNIFVAENTFTGTGSATKTVSGTIALSAGTLRAATIARGAQTGTNTVVVNTTFLWTGGTVGNLAGGDLVIDTLPLTLSSGTGTFQADAGRTITVNAASPISGAGSLVKAGDGTLVLAGSNGYTGATTISAGTLALASTASLGSSSTIAVNAGAAIDTSALVSGLVLTGSQTLAGAGSVIGSAAIGAGSTLAPGADLGTLGVSDGLTWNSGGNYNWQMLSGTGTAGSAWDLVSVTGTLAIGSTSADPFKVNLWTLSGVAPDVSGSAANFNPSQSYTWRIASAAGGITGFASDKFSIVAGATNGTGGFANSLGGGTFSIAQSGNDLNLLFTAGTPSVITINVPSGTQTQGQAGYPTLSGSVPVLKTGAGTLVLDQANTLSGSTSVQEGVLQLANGLALASSRLVVVAGGTGQVAPVTTTGVASLDLTSGNGLLDLTSGAITIASGMTATELVAEILEGRADGSWSGTSGITSSAAAVAVASGLPRAVGWIDNGDGSLTAAYAAPGDTNVDWAIDILDASNFLALGKFDTGLPATWIEGDFSYDGIVDILDAADFFATGLYDTGNYNTVPGVSGVAAVPEPGVLTIGLAAFAMLALSRRRG
jgi:autotransporter-associated beta strand protein